MPTGSVPQKPSVAGLRNSARTVFEFVNILTTYNNDKRTKANTPNPTPPPAAVTPVFVARTPADPTGVPNLPTAPFFQSTLIKFSAPTGTDIQVAVDGWIVRQQGTQAICDDDGCYQVVSQANDGAGQTTWLIQVWPRADQRRAHQLEFDITDVSFNAALTGDQLASKPLKLIMLPAASSTLGGPPDPSSVAGSVEWAAANETDALAYRTIGLSSGTDATSYYAAIGAGSKPTLTTWKTANHFGPDDSQDDAKAVYFNAGDLGFGRSMHMKVDPGCATPPNCDVAYYVSNYPTVDDAARKTNLIATVAMEYSAGPQGGPRFVKFYVYLNNDQLVPDAVLDGNGAKNVPNLCVVCHGLRKYTAGQSADLGARFLPFDLASFQYGLAPNARGQQEDQFKKLNLGILGTNPSIAETDLIQTWYRDPAQPIPNTVSPTQNSDAVPDQWLSHEPLYSKTIRVSCRTCHITREPGLGFGTFGEFQTAASRAQSQICGFRDMPNAVVTYERFWLERVGAPYANQLGAINKAQVTGWDSLAACP